MMEKIIKSLFLQIENTLFDALENIQRGHLGIALVVDANKKLIHTLTDGDIRRAIIAGIKLDESISSLGKLQPNFCTQPVVASVGTSREQLLQLFKEKNIRHIPIVDEIGRVVDLALLDKLIDVQPTNVSAVVMAGGEGRRLYPLTKDLPKPMLQIGDKPLLELILKRLSDSGIGTINISTGYKAEKIKEYFGDGRNMGLNIDYIDEDQPLGTAGALSLMTTPENPTLVMNGDILTEINFSEMVRYHLDCHADMTIAVRKYETTIPYGVVECNGRKVLALREKPVMSHLINAGIYLLQPTVYDFMNQGARLDMTELIQRLLDSGRTVVNFPIIEDWLDIGQLADYEKAQKDSLEDNI